MFSRMGADGYHEVPFSATSRKVGRHWTPAAPGLGSGSSGKMRKFLLLCGLCGLGLAGCASDESVVCDRLAECDLLPEGLSSDDCESQAVRQVPEDRLEKCAECVEEEDCKSLLDACRSDCEPG